MLEVIAGDPTIVAQAGVVRYRSWVGEHLVVQDRRKTDFGP